MKRLLLLSAFLTTGCTVVGSAFVERDLPDGRAVAKIEVHFTPPPEGRGPGRPAEPDRVPRRARDVDGPGELPASAAAGAPGDPPPQTAKPPACCAVGRTGEDTVGARGHGRAEAWRQAVAQARSLGMPGLAGP